MIQSFKLQKTQIIKEFNQQNQNQVFRKKKFLQVLRAYAV